MTNQFSFDKNTVDIIIAALTDVRVVKLDNYHIYFDGKALGCNEDGVYLSVWEKKSSLVMRGLSFPFAEFPWWQQRRLHKFFKAKQDAFVKAERDRQDAYHRENIQKNLNTTMTELVKYGK